MGEMGDLCLVLTSQVPKFNFIVITCLDVILYCLFFVVNHFFQTSSFGFKSFGQVFYLLIFEKGVGISLILYLLKLSLVYLCIFLNL